MTVAAPLDHVVLCGGFESVLRTEQSGQFDRAGCVHFLEHGQRGPQAGRHRGGVEQRAGAASVQARRPKSGQAVDGQDHAAHGFKRAVISAVMSSAPGASSTWGRPFEEAEELSNTRA